MCIWYIKTKIQIFKNSIDIHYPDNVDNAFLTVCILHNMLLEYDHLDSKWELDANWRMLNPPLTQNDDDVRR